MLMAITTMVLRCLATPAYTTLHVRRHQRPRQAIRALRVGGTPLHDTVCR